MTVDRSFHHRPPEARRAEGREARKALPRRVHGHWDPGGDRPDPVALLAAQDADRAADLVPHPLRAHVGSPSPSTGGPPLWPPTWRRRPAPA